MPLSCSCLCISWKRGFHQKNIIYTRQPSRPHSCWRRNIAWLFVRNVLDLFCGVCYSWCSFPFYLAQKKSRYGGWIWWVCGRRRPCCHQALTSSWQQEHVISVLIEKLYVIDRSGGTKYTFEKSKCNYSLTLTFW